jgi:hypothetical protein
MMSWLGAGAAVATTLLVGAGGELAPLQGTPLREPTGLRLLVAAELPAQLDVDTGKLAPVPGLARVELPLASIVGAGGKAGIVLADPSGDAPIYAVRGRPARLTPLGKARDLAPTPDGRTVWVKASAGGTSCVLRRVSLDGRARRTGARVPCGWLIEPGGSLGVVARKTRVIEPATGRTIYRARWGIIAAAGRRLVLAGPGKGFTLVDVAAGTERQLRWPSILAHRDAPAVDPRGRYVALAFADPAWSDETGNTIGQAMDVWLLDTQTGELTQVPGFPALLGLKFTSLEWTADGRLVVLGETDDRALVAVWRPGQEELLVKTVRLPKRSGSDSFAVVR